MAIADRLILSDETPFTDARFDKPLILSHQPGEQDLSRVSSHAGVPLLYQHVGADNPASPENHYGRFTAASVENLELAVDFVWSESNPSAMLAYAQRCETAADGTSLLTGASVGARFRKSALHDMGDHYRVAPWELVEGSLTPMPEIISIGLSADDDDPEYLVGLAASWVSATIDPAEPSTPTPEMEGNATMDPKKIAKLISDAHSVRLSSDGGAADAPSEPVPAVADPTPAADPVPAADPPAAVPDPAPAAAPAPVIDNRPQIQEYSLLALSNPTMDSEAVLQLTAAAMVQNLDPSLFAAALRDDQLKKSVNQTAHVPPAYARAEDKGAKPISLKLAVEYLFDKERTDSKYDALRAFDSHINNVEGRLKSGQNAVYVPFDQVAGFGDQREEESYVIRNTAGDTNNSATAGEGGNLMNSQAVGYVGGLYDPGAGDIVTEATTYNVTSGEPFVRKFTPQDARWVAEPTAAAGFTRGEPHVTVKLDLNPKILIWDVSYTRLLEMRTGMFNMIAEAEGRLSIAEQIGHALMGEDAAITNAVDGMYNKSVSARQTVIAANGNHATVDQIVAALGKMRDENVVGQVTLYIGNAGDLGLMQQPLVSNVSPFYSGQNMALMGKLRMGPTSHDFGADDKARAMMIANREVCWAPFDNAVYVALHEKDGVQNVRLELVAGSNLAHAQGVHTFSKA